jgi:hypothetical protein
VLSEIILDHSASRRNRLLPDIEREAFHLLFVWVRLLVDHHERLAPIATIRLPPLKTESRANIVTTGLPIVGR